jgi:prophage regulatory protein
VSRRLGLSIRHLERLEAAGKFPRRIRISPRAAGWLESEINEYIRDRIIASRGDQRREKETEAA